MATLGRPKPTLILSTPERSVLVRMARAMRRDRHGALRARIVLACAQCESNREVASRLGLAEHTVGKWRARFVQHRLAGLGNQKTDAPKRQGPLVRLGASLSPWHLGAALGLAAPWPKAAPAAQTA